MPRLLTLTTRRLLLRQFRDSDLDAYAARCADPEVARWTGTRQVMTRDDAWRQMATIRGFRIAVYAITRAQWSGAQRRTGD